MKVLHNNYYPHKLAAAPITTVLDDQEWTPSMFTVTQVKEIEAAWQYAAVVMSHFDVDDHDCFSSLLPLADDNEEEEAPLVTLSPTQRLSTPERYEDRDDVVREAVRRDARALVWASERLRSQGHVWLPLIRHQASLVRYLTCRDNVDFGLAAVTANPQAIYYLARSICYHVRILRVAWQGDVVPDDTNNEHYYHRPSSSMTMQKPLLVESYRGERTGSLLRYATVVLGLDVRQARRVARRHGQNCLADFDQWESDWQILEAVAAAKQHGQAKDDRGVVDKWLMETADSLSSSSSCALDEGGTSTTVALMEKSPFRTLRKTVPSWATANVRHRGRHVRKLSETQ